MVALSPDTCWFSEAAWPLPECSGLSAIDQQFPTFLMLGVPHAVTPNHKIVSLLVHNCNFATVMNHDVNI